MVRYVTVRSYWGKLMLGAASQFMGKGCEVQEPDWPQEFGTKINGRRKVTVLSVKFLLVSE